MAVYTWKGKKLIGEKEDEVGDDIGHDNVQGRAESEVRNSAS
jgi:hypothetical protein